VGKTALLHQFAWLAEQAGRRAVWLDGRETPPDAGAVLNALREQDAERHKNVDLLVDTYEVLATLDRWLPARIRSRSTGWSTERRRSPCRGCPGPR